LEKIKRMRKRILPLVVLLFLQPAAFPHLACADEPQGATPPWGQADAAAAPGTEAAETQDHAPPADLYSAPPPRERFWLRGEYLLWFTKNGNVPTLLTTGSSTDALPGALGQPGTKILYGGDVAFHDRSGARFTFGTTLAPDSIWSIEGSYFFLDARQAGDQVSSPGNPVLARPFFDVGANQQNSSLVTYPGLLKGGIDISNTSYLQGAEGNLQALLWTGERLRFEMLAGFRYLDLVEALTIQENAQVDPSSGVYGGNNILVTDRFSARNHFYGGQLGMRAEFNVKRLTFGLVGKVALGDVNEMVNIQGQTAINTIVPTNAAGGLLALSSNSGSFNRNAFAVVPELGINAGLKITPRLTALVGYTFLYWSRVVRPGDQVDTGLNTSLIPTSTNFGAGGAARPAFAFHESTYWAQGLNLGLQFRY
jgi:hypothetical protein